MSDSWILSFVHLDGWECDWIASIATAMKYVLSSDVVMYPFGTPVINRSEPALR